MKYIPNVQIPFVDFSKKAVVDDWMSKINAGEMIPGVPEGVSLSMILADSLQYLHGYKENASSLDSEDEEGRYSLQQLNDPLTKALRENVIDFSKKENIDEIYNYLLSGRPTSLIHPQEFVFERIATSLIRGQGSYNYLPFMDKIAQLLQMAKESENVTSNMDCYSTRRDEYFVRDDNSYNSAFELLAMLGPDCVNEGLPLYPLLYDMAKEQMPRYTVHKVYDGKKQLDPSIYDISNLATLSGGTGVVRMLANLGRVSPDIYFSEFTDKNIPVSSEAFYTNFAAFFTANKSESQVKSYLSEVDSFIRSGIINVDSNIHIGESDAGKFDPSELGEDPKTNSKIVSMLSAIRVLYPQAYESVLSSKLSVAAKGMAGNKAPVEVNITGRKNLHL